MTATPSLERVAGRERGLLLAALGTAFFSTSAVLVRLTAGYGPLEVASYRLLGGAAFVALFAVIGRTGLRLGDRAGGAGAAPVAVTSGAAASARGAARPQLLAVVTAGLVAALHFAFYVGSLYRTTIAHSLVLVNLSPVLSVPLAALFLKEKFDLRRLPGVAGVVVGLAVMVGLEPSLTRGQLLGDLMAFLAALAYAVYSLIGRSQRSDQSPGGLLAYTFWVYLIAGLALLPLAQGQRAFTLGPPPTTAGLVAILLLALLPTAAGHTLYNAALRRAGAVTVNLIATQEVTGGVLLGYLLLGETPSVQALVGGLITLGGLYLVLRR